MSNNKNTSRLWKLFRGVLGSILILVLAVFIPWTSGNLSAHPNPATSYEESFQRIEAFESAEGVDFNPQCHTRFMTHGQKVQNVIVLIHGYTNCPQQFA